MGKLIFCFWKTLKTEKEGSENEMIQSISEFIVKIFDLYLFLEKEKVMFECYQHIVWGWNEREIV